MSFVVEASCGAARRGTVTTLRGSFRTPCFMPVGTRAAVRAVSIDEVESLGYEVILANTYHLMLRPGAEVVAALGGVHRFSSWGRHVLTDSGGYQLFSLKARYDEEGVSFRSVYDGSSHRLTPEQAVRVQACIGSDIQMALDVCSALPTSAAALREAMELTIRWARRAYEEWTRLGGALSDRPALFGIVQGGDEDVLRRESARRTAEISFDGFGIGGLSVGEPHDRRRAALQAALDELPWDRPRYLMGVGDPPGILEAISMGVDMFDCVLPTRLGRHGTVLTSAGRLSLRRSLLAADDRPPDPGCRCRVCQRFSRAYLRHLFVVGDPSAQRLATLHNLAWTSGLIDRARASIDDGSIDTLASELADAYGRNGDD